MFTSKEIEEFSKQTNIKKNDFITIRDHLQQNGYRFKKKNTSLLNCTTIESYSIGMGDQSYIILGEIIKNGEEVAIKFSNYKDGSNQDLLNKFQTLHNICCNNFIVKVYDHFIFEEQQILIQIVELCQKSLKDEIDQMKLKKTNFSVDQVVKVFLFAINALCEIHSNGIIHLNIKPTNILISKDGEYKLTDFGISNNVKQHEMYRSPIEKGSNIYLSPEQLQKIEQVENNNEQIKLKCSTDIYSMGATLLEILDFSFNVKLLSDLKQKNFFEIKTQINFDKQNFYAFVVNFMLQQEQNNRYIALSLRQKFIKYFESIFPFEEEYNRINKLIKKHEVCSQSNNNINKHLAYLYFYLSQTNLRNQDCQMIEKSLSIMKYLNALKSFDISIFYENYSNILMNSQKYEESNRYLILSMEIKISFFQNVHLQIDHNLLLQSYCQYSLGNYQKSLDQCQNSLQILEIIFEKKDNPDIATCLQQIGRANSGLGDVQKGFEYYLKALQMREKLFSGNHPDIAQSLNSVGCSYENLDDVQKELEYYLKALQMREALFSGNHPDKAWSLNNVGCAYAHLGDKQQGLEYQLKALKMSEALFTENHSDIAWFLNNIGCSYDHLGDTQKGLEFKQRALKIREAVFSGNHPHIAVSLNYVGYAYEKLGDVQKGLDYYLKALKMFEALFSGNHPDISNSLTNVGVAYHQLGDVQKGLIYHLKALQMLETLYSGNHTDIAWSLNIIGCAYEELENLQKGLIYYLKAHQKYSLLQQDNKVQQLQQQIDMLKQNI